MFCTVCGYKMSDNDLFCPNCGTRIIGLNGGSNSKPMAGNTSKKLGVSTKAASEIRRVIEEATDSQKMFGERWYSWSAGEILEDPMVDSLGELVTGIEDEIPLIVYKYNRTYDLDFKEGVIITNYRIIAKFGSKDGEWFWNELSEVTYDKILLAHVIYLNLKDPKKKRSFSMPLTYLDNLKKFKPYFAQIAKVCIMIAENE